MHLIDPPSSFYFLYVEAKLHWGFACRLVPFGKSRLTLKIPPPSTLLGALAYPLARQLGWPEVILDDPGESAKSGADRVRKFLVSAHARMRFAPSIRSDINRVFWYYFLKKEVRTDAIALEKVYANPLPGEEVPKIDIIYVIDTSQAEGALGPRWPALLEISAWAMTRVGQKEGLITVEEVQLADAKLLNEEVVSTEFYFPLEASTGELEGSWIQEMFVDPWETGIGEYAGSRTRPFIVPFSTVEQRPTEVKVRLSAEGVALDCGGHTVVSLRRWLGYEG